MASHLSSFGKPENCRSAASKADCSPEDQCADMCVWIAVVAAGGPARDSFLSNFTHLIKKTMLAGTMLADTSETDSLAALLDACGLSNGLASSLAGETSDGLKACLADSGRVALLKRLGERGLSLPERQKLANGLGRLARGQALGGSPTQQPVASTVELSADGSCGGTCGFALYGGEAARSPPPDADAASLLTQGWAATALRQLGDGGERNIDSECGTDTNTDSENPLLRARILAALGSLPAALRCYSAVQGADADTSHAEAQAIEALLSQLDSLPGLFFPRAVARGHSRPLATVDARHPTSTSRPAPFSDGSYAAAPHDPAVKLGYRVWPHPSPRPNAPLLLYFHGIDGREEAAARDRPRSAEGPPERRQRRGLL